MIKLFLCLIVINLMFINSSWAKPYVRTIDLDWESVNGAVLYELEFTKISSEFETRKKIIVKSKTSSWTGELKPGKYQLRLRSYDSRFVPGDWNKPEDILIAREDLVIVQPKNNQSLESNDSSKEKVEFNWNPVDGSEKYLISIKSSDEKTKIEEETDEPKFSAKLPVANQYSWTVTALDSKSQPTESSATANLTIFGAELQPPEIEQPKNEFVRELKWSAETEEQVSDYDIIIQKKSNPNNPDWEAFKNIKKYKMSSLKFPAAWPGGQYNMKVSANGYLRKSSKYAEVTFNVRSGSRTVKAELQNMFQQSIAGINGWYGIASYLVTKVSYLNQNYDTGGELTFSNLGGTGRLGLGFTPDSSPYGFLAIADLSGFLYNDRNHLFYSMQGDGTYRISLGRSELRLSLGASLKQLPDITLDQSTQEIRESHVTQLGPHFGGELWYSLTPKIGLQLNTHIIYSFLKISTPNNATLVPSISDQFGFLISYRLNKKFTGLVGYALRHDRSAYLAQSGQSGSLATDGQVNQNSLVGNYINFFAEWKL